MVPKLTATHSGFRRFITLVFKGVVFALSALTVQWLEDKWASAESVQ
ncbi:MAG: hypothetical protein OXC62_00170 [Aestuariivita sp.]|nr:hypothetical protein [Aestuariivita sp.]